MTPLDSRFDTEIINANQALRKRRETRRAVDAYREGGMEPIIFVPRQDDDTPDDHAEIPDPIIQLDRYVTGLFHGAFVALAVVLGITGLLLWKVL